MARTPARTQGEIAGLAGLSALRNPYDRGTYFYFEWLDGWTWGIARERRDRNRVVVGSAWETHGMRLGSEARVVRFSGHS